MAFHDPCYLGRANRVYDPPREVINAVPGIRLKELRRRREEGFCCGGGGGRMWLHEHLGRRMNTMRAEEVIETGVDLLGTACPYCLTMLEDGIKSLDVQKPPKVLDILEMVASSLR
ncbi:MAG: (Fe-S)-binding protein [Pseudomonadota bacterium]